jgi:hypothetical protein
MMNCDYDEKKKCCRCRLACSKKRRILSFPFRDRRRLDWNLFDGVELNWIGWFVPIDRF